MIGSAPTERGATPRFISSGGNIYSVDYVVPRVGEATRDRGFWVGRERDDLENPDVDNPQARPANTKERDDCSEDDANFGDTDDPFASFNRNSYLKDTIRPQLKAARALLSSTETRKAEHVGVELKGATMDLLIADPEKMSEEQLVKSAGTVKMLLADPNLNAYERTIFEDRAQSIAHFIRKALERRQRTETATDVADHQKAKQPKAMTKVGDKNGKVQYKYPKVDNAKGPNSDGNRPADQVKRAQQTARDAAPEQQPTATGEVTPAKDVDPTHFCKLIGVSPSNLQSFAQKKTQQEFVRFFEKQASEKLKENGINASFLARLYDALVSPPPAEEKPDTGSVAGKSIIVFSSSNLKNGSRGLIRKLIKSNVSTIDTMMGCLQDHFRCSGEDAEKLTRTLLRRWERDGVVSFIAG